MAAQKYITRAGDLVDSVCQKYYGNTLSATITAVYEANRPLDLANLGPVLPAGLVIVLPDVVAPTQTTPVKIWD